MHPFCLGLATTISQGGAASDAIASNHGAEDEQRKSLHGHRCAGPGWALKPCRKQMLASIQAARPVALCLRAIAAALLTSALLLQVRWDTLRFVVQILAQSRSKA